jgi:GNAT superfamily N-acetyltransferase
MQEAFWYIAKDHRRGLGGMRLLKEIEQFAKDAGISRLIMGRVHASDPEGKLDAMLNRMGYAAIETNYRKIIYQDA